MKLASSRALEVPAVRACASYPRDWRVAASPRNCRRRPRGTGTGTTATLVAALVAGSLDSRRGPARCSPPETETDVLDASTTSRGMLQDIDDLGGLLLSLLDGSYVSESSEETWLQALRVNSKKGYIPLEAFLYLPLVQEFFEQRGVMVGPTRFAWLSAAVEDSRFIQVRMAQDVHVRLKGWRRWKAVKAEAGALQDEGEKEVSGGLKVAWHSDVSRRSIDAFQKHMLVQGRVIARRAEEASVWADIGASIPCRVIGLQHEHAAYVPGVRLKDLMLEEVVLEDQPVLVARELPPIPWKPPLPGQSIKGVVTKVTGQSAIIDIGKTLHTASVPKRVWRRQIQVGESLRLRVLDVAGKQVTLRELYEEEDEPIYCQDAPKLRRGVLPAGGTPAPGWPPWEAAAQLAEPTPWYQVPRCVESAKGAFIVPAEAGEGTSLEVVDFAVAQNEVRGVAAIPAPTKPTERIFPGAILVGQVLSNSANGITLDLAEECTCWIPESSLQMPSENYVLGQALPLRVMHVGESARQSAIRARPLYPSEMSEKAQSMLQGIKAKEGMLPLPRMGTLALGQVVAVDPPRLELFNTPGTLALLPLSGSTQPAVGTWVRGLVRGVDISVDGHAMPVLAPPATVAEALQLTFDASAVVIPELTQTLSDLPPTGEGRVIGYAQDWTLPDGSTSNGILIAVNGSSNPLFADVPLSALDVRLQSPLGKVADKLRIEDFVEHDGQTYALIRGRVREDLTVGSFQKVKTLKPSQGQMWSVSLGKRRLMLSLWQREEQLKEGQEVMVRVLNTGSPGRLPWCRLLYEEEAALAEEDLQQEAPPFPNTQTSVCGRVLGVAATLLDDPGEAWASMDPALHDLYRRSDPQRVAQSVDVEDVLVAIDAVPCIGVVPGAFAETSHPGDTMTHLQAVDICGVGPTAYAALEPPRVEAEALQGKVVEGILRAKTGSGYLIDVGAQVRDQPVYGMWKLEGHPDQRFAQTLHGPGQRISNVTVLKVDIDSQSGRTNMLVSPTAGNELELKDMQILEGTVGQIHEYYGIFFEVGCRSRVLCRAINLLRPQDQYRYGQRVRRLFVHWPKGGDRPQLSEGGPPMGFQALGSPEETTVQRKVFGVAEGDQLDGRVLEKLPYGVILEFEEAVRDGFCAKDNLFLPLEDYAIGDELHVEVVNVSFYGDAIVQQCAKCP